MYNKDELNSKFIGIGILNNYVTKLELNFYTLSTYQTGLLIKFCECLIVINEKSSNRTYFPTLTFSLQKGFIDHK